MANRKKKNDGEGERPKPQELTGLPEGPGVSPVVIPELTKAAQDYIRERDKRCAMTPKEIAAKQKLMEVVHANVERLGRNPKGQIVYAFDDQILIVKPGKETLQVKAAESVEVDEAD